MDDKAEEYDRIVATSERVAFRLDDVIGDGLAFDFGRPFLPESLAGVATLEFLSDAERLTLNHVRGHGYLAIFGVLEEGILPFVMDRLRDHGGPASTRVRALLRFAEEEVKHIQLFDAFDAAFQNQFGVEHALAFTREGSRRGVERALPLASALMTLHVERMTQAHYVESVKSAVGLDGCFARLLKLHWLEESQHARLDELIVEALAESCDRDTAHQAVAEYEETCARIAGRLSTQVDLDLRTFEMKTGRTLDTTEQDELLGTQLEASQRTFLRTGREHPSVDRWVRELASR